MLRYQTMQTSAGPLTVAVSDAGAVRAAGFTAAIDDLLPLIHASLREEAVEAADVGPVRGRVDAYFGGDLGAIDDVVIEQRGGEFMAHAWDVMREIKPGAPVTYSDFATMSGRPAAIRAAAAACARNAVALFAPCHRVFRLDGSLGGYRWGLQVKRVLLDHEAA